MSDQDRRAFLRKIAKGAVYVAPVVYSMALPTRVMASHKPGHTMMPMGSAPAQQQQQQPTTQRDAPWQRPPPGSTPPGSDREPIKRQ